jgi:hypothetical protein
MWVRSKQVFTRFIVVSLMVVLLAPTSTPASPLRADDWLSSTIAAVTNVLNAISRWNEAIDTMQAQAERAQFKRRLRRLYNNFLSIELRKQRLRDELLSRRPNPNTIRTHIRRLSQDVDMIGENINGVSRFLNQENSLDGLEVESRLREDLSTKSDYLRRIEDLLREDGRIPDADLETIRSQGNTAIQAMRSARVAIGSTLRRL